MVIHHPFVVSEDGKVEATTATAEAEGDDGAVRPRDSFEVRW